MKIIILNNENEIAQQTASLFSQQIKMKSNSVLGLATGSSPIKTYQELIKMYKNKEISFKNITTFNLDEYCGLQPSDKQSYRFFMNNQLFDYIDISKENTFVPNGLNNTNPSSYDKLIEQHGGIDMQLLGIGINGHIGFNEPGSSFESLTSEVDLTQSTIDTNAKKFFNGDTSKVPTKAISMGLKSIINAKKIILIASGEEKAQAIQALVEEQISTNWPCTILRKHNDVTLIIDQAAASLLHKDNR